METPEKILKDIVIAHDDHNMDGSCRGCGLDLDVTDVSGETHHELCPIEEAREYLGLRLPKKYRKQNVSVLKEIK